jgi:hypothetical protein
LAAIFLAWLGGFNFYDEGTWPGWFSLLMVFLYFVYPIGFLAYVAVEYPIIFALLASAFGIALLKDYFTSKRKRAKPAEPKKPLSILEAAERYWPSIRTGDPLSAVRFVARQLIRDEWRRQGRKNDYSAKELTEAADEYLRKHPELIAEARKRVTPSNPVAAACQ